MNETSELLANASLEDTEASVDKEECFDHTVLKPVLRLRKTFDHFLFFRTICETTSGHTAESEQIVAGLPDAGEVTLSHD